MGPLLGAGKRNGATVLAQKTPLVGPCPSRQADPVVSLAKLFGKSDPFFDLLAISAKSAHQSVEALARLLGESHGNVSLAELAVARRRVDGLGTEIPS